jgi:hypothetical protein
VQIKGDLSDLEDYFVILFLHFVTLFEQYFYTRSTIFEFHVDKCAENVQVAGTA